MNHHIQILKDGACGTSFKAGDLIPVQIMGDFAYTTPEPTNEFPLYDYPEVGVTYQLTNTEGVHMDTDLDQETSATTVQLEVQHPKWVKILKDRGYGTTYTSGRVVEVTPDLYGGYKDSNNNHFDEPVPEEFEEHYEFWWGSIPPVEEQQPGERDPNGLNQHEPGAKADDGKIRVDLVLGSFSRALYTVCANGTLGAIKYTPGGFLSVENGQERYADAKGRHWLKKHIGRKDDDQFNLPELTMAAWNSLAELELALRAEYPDPEEFIEVIDGIAKQVAIELQGGK